MEPGKRIPAHADDETIIEPQSTILTYSLYSGATITFTKKYNKNFYINSFEVKHGDIYTVSGVCQQILKHEIINNNNSTRVSLTFRKMKSSENENT